MNMSKDAYYFTHDSNAKDDPKCALLIDQLGMEGYGIYWMLKLNDEINLLCGDTNAASGALVVIFSLITCGIYGFYWMYKMGEKCDFIKGVQGSSGILYLLLGIFGLSIVDFCLIQDTINKSV